MFNQRRIGMKLSDSEGAAFFRKNLGENLGVVPFPISSDGIQRNPIVNVSGIGISAKSNHIDAA